MNRWIVLSLTILLSAAFAQSPAKTYKWMHPWFKKEIVSPTPPTWPYRVIDEKNGIVLVEVTPPGTAVAAPPAPEPVSAPTKRPTPNQDSENNLQQVKETACKSIGNMARVAVQTKNKGISQEAMEDVVRKQKMSSEAYPSMIAVVRSIYANNWSEQEAEQNIIRSCAAATALPTFSEFAQSNPSQSPATRLSASFDIEIYCKHIGEVAGGSYRIEQTCRNQERSAVTELESMNIATKIDKYCAHIGEVAGGSYHIMLTCVKQETTVLRGFMWRLGRLGDSSQKSSDFKHYNLMILLCDVNY